MVYSLKDSYELVSKYKCVFITTKLIVYIVNDYVCAKLLSINYILFSSMQDLNLVDWNSFAETALIAMLLE